MGLLMLGGLGYGEDVGSFLWAGCEWEATVLIVELTRCCDLETPADISLEN